MPLIVAGVNTHSGTGYEQGQKGERLWEVLEQQDGIPSPFRSAGRPSAYRKWL